ncbi:MAG: hypothetical protein AB8G99_18980 [Planctomycetaceae bacterium]
MSFDGAPPKKGMGTGAKVLIILGILAGVAALACCGGIGYFGYQMKPVITTTASEVTERTGTIAEMEINQEKFEPKMHMSMSIPMVMDMSIAKWDSKLDDGGLLLTKILMKIEDPNQNQDDVDRQMEQAFSQGGGNQDGQPQMAPLVGTSTPETLTFLGEECEFTYTEGKRQGSDDEYKELKGHGKRGKEIVVVRIQAKAENFDKQAILDMLAQAK